MIVCPQCASKFGATSLDTSPKQSSMRTRPSWIGVPERPTETTSKAPQPVVKKPKPRPPPNKGVLLDDLMLIEEYDKAIRTARQKMGISQEELAQRVGERISTLQAIEAGRQKPNNKTIRGLERELGISLLEPIDPVPIRASRSVSTGGPTLGDRVVVKRKKPKKSD
jgi:putative transcription factor